MHIHIFSTDKQILSYYEQGCFSCFTADFSCCALQCDWLNGVMSSADNQSDNTLQLVYTWWKLKNPKGKIIQILLANVSLMIIHLSLLFLMRPVISEMVRCHKTWIGKIVVVLTVLLDSSQLQCWGQHGTLEELCSGWTVTTCCPAVQCQCLYSE